MAGRSRPCQTRVAPRTDLLNLHVVIASTRPGRAGLPVGKWFYEFARTHGKFETRLVDLAEVNLPLFDEPKHPRLGQYEKPHTKVWSDLVAAADAFAFVVPEYNYSAPPTLINALDYLHREWQYKPACFVSYGGVAGGARAVAMAKTTVTALKMVALFEGVTIPWVTQHIKDGVFEAEEAHVRSATAMLDELLRWAEALESMRGRR
jgi:NAD(P)H-dependent FMN reductase